MVAAYIGLYGIVLCSTCHKDAQPPLFIVIHDPFPYLQHDPLYHSACTTFDIIPLMKFVNVGAQQLILRPMTPGTRDHVNKVLFLSCTSESGLSQYQSIYMPCVSGSFSYTD